MTGCAVPHRASYLPAWYALEVIQDFTPILALTDDTKHRKVAFLFQRQFALEFVLAPGIEKTIGTVR